ncbi:hypothetical protein [Embleya sp. NBC_00896]|uniref:hypothetical protein n=1 Tax=Embleya sp. NBC_00896 TaxID=2975961 RepID=UPI003865B4C1|nr:hypothetical protein OG928_25760 [Embleya sp. NBC_00896]
MRTLSTPPPPDERLTTTYYIDPNRATHRYVTDVLARCARVFDVKPAIAADLDHLTTDIADTADVHPDARLTGAVRVENGARVEAGATIAGPVLICAGAVIGAGAVIRDHTVIGPDCRIAGGAEITRSLLAGRVLMVHQAFVGDSILGHGINVGAFCTTTGMRVTGPVTEPATTEITLVLDDERITTGQTKFGAVIGDDVALPAGTVLSPATLIGPGTVIFPRNHIGGVLPRGTRIR